MLDEDSGRKNVVACALTPFFAIEFGKLKLPLAVTVVELPELFSRTTCLPEPRPLTEPLITNVAGVDGVPLLPPEPPPPHDTNAADASEAAAAKRILLIANPCDECCASCEPSRRPLTTLGIIRGQCDRSYLPRFHIDRHPRLI